MLNKRFKQPVFVLSTLLLIAFFSSIFYEASNETHGQLSAAYSGEKDHDFTQTLSSVENGDSIDEQQSKDSLLEPHANGDGSFENTEMAQQGPDDEEPTDYREIFSATTWDRKYVPIFYQSANVINPSIIPHPTQYFLWLVIAQHVQPGGQALEIAEQIGCTATFYEGVLLCTTTSTTVPVSPSIPGRCEGAYAGLNAYKGPRNARVFYGPEAPYIMYSSHSQHGCIGVWIQDARMLLDPLYFEHFVGPQVFKDATELQTPLSRQAIAENYFLFWDDQGQVYVHHALFPQRTFAQLESDGSVGHDLAPNTATSDQFCYAKYLPNGALGPGAVQQATNALAVTLCERKDSKCVPNDSNTFNMHVFHVESSNSGQTMYEPYTVLFQHSAPFAIHAISQAPLWVHGRKVLSPPDDPDVRTESVYITSMNWKVHTQKYHGYIDDTLFLGFGMNESHPGAMDVAAGDLLQDLAFC